MSTKYKSVGNDEKGFKLGIGKSFEAYMESAAMEQSRAASQVDGDDDTSAVVMGSFAATQSPSSSASEGSGSISGSKPFFSLTKKKKPKKEPKIQSSGVVNYGGIGGDQNSDSESDGGSSASSLSSNHQGYNLPFHMQSAYPKGQINNEIDDDELSQRTPIPKAPPNPAINAVLPSDFLRNRCNSETNISDISEDDSIIKRQKREQENVGRLVHAAKQQQSFALAWFSAGQAENALPPIPPKPNKPINPVVRTKKTTIVEPNKSSGPIDLDSGEMWKTDNDTDGEDSKKNLEIGSFHFSTAHSRHSAPTRKRANKKSKMIQFGVPDDEDLTTYYMENKFLDRIACTIGQTRCSFLALLMVGLIVILLSGGAIVAGIFLTQQGTRTPAPSPEPSAAPTISQLPTISLIPTVAPSSEPTMTPSLIPSATLSTEPSSQPTSNPSVPPSRQPTSEPSLTPSSTPSSSPTKMPSSQPSSQPSLSSKPSNSPSEQPSRCFVSVEYKPQGSIQKLENTNGSDKHGYSVSVSANGLITAASAIRITDNSGAVSIYEQINNDWELKGNRITGETDFGTNIELADDGLTVVIGSPSVNEKGLARVYRFNSNTQDWEQLGTDISENDSVTAGFSVAISGDGQIIAIGDPKYDYVGRVMTYKYNSVTEVWDRRGSPIGEFSGDFGHSVSLSKKGNIVASGSPLGGSFLSGFAMVLQWDINSEDWNLLGQEIKYTDIFGIVKFGETVSLASDESKPRIVIAAPELRVDTKEGSGAVSVWDYDSNQNIWNQVGNDIVGVPESNQFFGYSVSIAGDGTHVAIGIPYKLNGEVYLYFWNGNIWDEVGPLKSGTGFTALFGRSVDLSEDGTFLVAGAPELNKEGYWQAFKSNKEC